MRLKARGMSSVSVSARSKGRVAKASSGSARRGARNNTGSREVAKRRTKSWRSKTLMIATSHYNASKNAKKGASDAKDDKAKLNTNADKSARNNTGGKREVKEVGARVSTTMRKRKLITLAVTHKDTSRNAKKGASNNKEVINAKASARGNTKGSSNNSRDAKDNTRMRMRT